MKYAILCAVFVLSNTIVYSSDDEKRFLLGARSDKDDVSSIQSLNFDTQKLYDETWKDCVSKALNVEKISAKNNNLMKPEHLCLLNVTHIDLSSGTIVEFKIGRWVQVMPYLQELNLANNKIVSIATDYGSTENSWKSDVLTKLNLSHNNLTVFDMNIINSLSSLVEADFSHNQIKQIIVQKSSQHHSVCTIQLHNNKLGDEQQAQLQSYSMLESRKLGHYKWLCSGIGCWFSIVPAIPFTLGIANSGEILAPPSTLGFFVFMGGIACLAGACSYAGEKVALYTLPVHERTYKAFVFVFKQDAVMSENV